MKDGVITGGGRRLTYGELVRGQELKLTIPVEGNLTSMFGLTVAGNPPMKPASQYTIIGKSFANAVTPGKVTGKEQWVTNVRLPDMLHGRVVHPKTLGSTLVSAGTLDKAQFPTAKVIVKGNLVGVVASTEWEAIKAAQNLAASTQWTDWKGLPGHTQVHTVDARQGGLEGHARRERRQEQGRHGSGARLGRQDIDCELRTALHEARADRPDDCGG